MPRKKRYPPQAHARPAPGPDHLSREVLIHCCKDRTLTYRTRREPIFNGVALPVFSVDSKEEAETLLLLVGRRQYVEHPKLPGRPWLKITLDGALDLKLHLDLDDLPAVTAKLQSRYDMMCSVKQKEG